MRCTSSINISVNAQLHMVIYICYVRGFVCVKRAIFHDSVVTQWQDEASKVTANVNAYGKSNDSVFGWFEHRGSVCVRVLAVYRAGVFIHCGASHTMNQASLLPSPL